MLVVALSTIAPGSAVVGRDTRPPQRQSQKTQDGISRIDPAFEDFQARSKQALLKLVQEESPRQTPRTLCFGLRTHSLAPWERELDRYSGRRRQKSDRANDARSRERTDGKGALLPGVQQAPMLWFSVLAGLEALARLARESYLSLALGSSAYGRLLLAGVGDPGQPRRWRCQ